MMNAPVEGIKKTRQRETCARARAARGLADVQSHPEASCGAILYLKIILSLRAAVI